MYLLPKRCTVKNSGCSCVDVVGTDVVTAVLATVVVAAAFLIVSGGCCAVSILDRAVKDIAVNHHVRNKINILCQHRLLFFDISI